jgi:hypothetical protein
MSLAGNRIAVVSLGSSCQSAIQLRRHAQFISGIVNDELKHVRHPLDWVVSPIAKTTEWLRSADLFPASPDDLTPVPGLDGVFLWDKRGVYFWHDFRNSNEIEMGIDLVGTFEPTRASYERGFAKLHDLKTFDRVVIIVANTQNNMPDVLGPTYPADDFNFTAANCRALKNSFEELLGRSSEMLCVTYADRSSDELQSVPEQEIVVVRIARDPSVWEGDPAIWEKLLSDYFTPVVSVPENTPEVGRA